MDRLLDTSKKIAIMLICSFELTIIELGCRKMSWFVSGEQINYLLQLSASTNNWSGDTDKSQYFALTDFNNCVINRSVLFLLENLFEIHRG